MLAFQRNARRFAIQKIAFVVMLFCSVIFTAITAQPAQLGIRVLDKETVASLSAVGDAEVSSIIGLDLDDDEEDDTDYSGPTWMPETEAEHPMHLPAATHGVNSPILLHGEAWHIYHDFFRSMTPAPKTPPPNAA